MAIGLFEMQVLLASVSGIPSDQFVHTFHFGSNTGDSVEDDAAAIALRLWNFYNANDPNQNIPVGRLLAECVSRGVNATETVAYFKEDFDPAVPFGSPVYSEHWTLTALSASAGEGVPSECAITMSFHGDLTNVAQESGNTRPAARRRGRLFFGPINAEPLAKDATTKRIFVDANVRSALCGTAQELAAANDAIIWSVYSRADQFAYTITGGWVDDAFDTQRRRGEDASTRTLWP